MTYKQNNRDNSGATVGTLEDEIIVNDYAETDRLLYSIGLNEKGVHENYREVWRLKFENAVVDIMLDEWPFVQPFIELEVIGRGDEGDLQRCAEALGLSWLKAVAGSVIPVYTAEYLISEDDFRAYRGPMTFDQPKPEFLKK